MNGFVFRRAAAAAVLAAALAAGTPAHAAGRIDAPASVNVLERAWQWIASLWGGEKGGMHIDPNGKPAVSTGTTGGEATEIGITIDPDG